MIWVAVAVAVVVLPLVAVVTVAETSTLSPVLIERTPSRWASMMVVGATT
jgi:hypothetical protein